MIRIGIIGYGSWVKDAYIPALEHDGRAEIVAISAKSQSSIRLIENSFGNAVEIFSDYRELLNSGTPEAVMIAVPDSMHAEILTAALNSGKPVFYEPPVAHTRLLIPELIKKLVAVTQITHADLELALIPVITKASALMKDGVIEKIQSAAIRLQSNWGPAPDQDINNINRLSIWYTHVL